jgi:hypothetical protein
MDENLRKILEAGKEPNDDADKIEYRKTAQQEEFVTAQKSNGENIVIPQNQVEVQLSWFGKFKALMKRNKLINGTFFLVFTIIVMVLLVLLARLFNIKLG